MGHPSDVPIRSRRIGLACPRESTQREGPPEAASALVPTNPAGRDFPCVHRCSGGAHNSAAPVGSASDRMRALIPERLRYSARPTGPGCSSLSPLAQPSIAGKTGASEAMSERIERQRDRELGERRFCREAQGTRVSGQASGPPFFGVLFFGGAKKSTSPDRAKPVKTRRSEIGNKIHAIIPPRLKIVQAAP